jgi:lysozyme
MFGFLKTMSPMVRNTGLGLVTAAMVSAGTFLGLSIDKGAPMTAQFEGEVLKNYIDVVGVETWCYGETKVGRLEAGYTREYCMALFLKSYAKYSQSAYNCYDAEAKKHVTPAIHAGITDVFFNAGANCKSSMVRHLKAGKPMDACFSLLLYKYAGGKDCSIRSNGCFGVWDRRRKFYQMCALDAQKLPKGGLQ